ncbi:hypothetical protein [Bradyrhizobium sp. CCBAU 21362]|uniref:hypothetical protein n=1 Tax=Bradyrhizobium sp. CCBAU 21362 TaxID=1325082 RepID=UPI003FA409DD
MGTIVARKRKDGSTGYTAQILRKKSGKILHREAQTFDRRQAAVAWLKRRETELSEPGALDRAKMPDKSLANAIDRYTAESRKVIGKTKAQVLASIKEYDIADMECGEIRSQDIVGFANELFAGNRQPATVGNYISHLAAIFAIARPAWGYRLDESQMKDAQAVLRQMGVISKSKSRDRRPTLPELDILMEHFIDRSKRDPNAALMHRVIAAGAPADERLLVPPVRKRKDPVLAGQALVADVVDEAFDLLQLGAQHLGIVEVIIPVPFIGEDLENHRKHGRISLLECCDVVDLDVEVPDDAPCSRQKTGVVRRMSAVSPEHGIPRGEWEMTSRYEVDSRAL